MTTGLPFDDFRALVVTLPGPDVAAVEAVRERNEKLTKPPGSLGRLESLAEWLAAWQGRAPAVTKPLVAVFAGTHGVTGQGVSPYPAEVTAQMVTNFAAGGAAINQICIACDIGLKVFDLALEHPTADFTQGAALDERSCAATMAFGMEAVAGGTDLLCIGEMGISNTTVAAAIYCALFGGGASEWVGAGTGADDTMVARKAEVVVAGLERHASHLGDPLEVLRRLGGREIAAMTGAILAARTQRVPVLIDGFVAGAAAAILHAMEPHALDHCRFAHRSAERGHARALERMGAEPILDLGMRLGEGTGAALAVPILRAAALCHTGMATFEQAAVSNRA